MPAKKGDQRGGIRTIEGLRVRCFNNPDTLCWEWRGAWNIRRPGKIEMHLWLADERKSVTIMRASWLLSGKRTLKPGETVWPRCGVDSCCNPAHMMAGTKAQWGAWVTAQGNLRGRPERSAINRRIKEETGQTSLNMELAAWIRESQQRGRVVAHALGVSEQVISRVRRFQTFKPPRSASIFTMAQWAAAPERKAA